MDQYWAEYEACLDRVAADGSSVPSVVAILNHYYAPSAGEAFHPGGADRTLVGVLLFERNDWTTVWSEADYYCCLQDTEGNTMTFVEGDIYRGNHR